MMDFIHLIVKFHPEEATLFSIYAVYDAHWLTDLRFIIGKDKNKRF